MRKRFARLTLVGVLAVVPVAAVAAPAHAWVPVVFHPSTTPAPPSPIPIPYPDPCNPSPCPPPTK
jgi:hypothetical protein